MELIVLGTGNAMSTRYYNTCFALREGAEAILVDAGGGNGILRQLDAAELPATALRHLIITHAHCDHLLGAVWIVRKVGTLMAEGQYSDDFTIHCHMSVREALCAMCGYTLEKRFVRLLGERILFDEIDTGSTCNMLGMDFAFFDILSTKMLQYGFTAQLPHGGKLTCLGDEPYNPACRTFVEGSDWILSEAFCLYGDRDRFKPYEKHHSTVREACILAEELNTPHLVIWHTEDKTFPERKARYTAEGRSFYHGDLRVPNDLETIKLE